MKEVKTSVVIAVVTLLITLGWTNVALADTLTQRYVPFQDIEIFTEAYNYSPKEKEAIIFTHGLGSDHRWAEFLYHPSNPYMTISFDYLNHGNTGKVPVVTWDNHLDSINAIIDAYGLKKVYLVGHSFGADTAIMFAKRNPKVVKKVVLIDRAFCNFADLEQFNMTRELTELLEYNPDSGLSVEEFYQYVDMAWKNDITDTWDIKEKVLLLVADPTVTFNTNPPLPEILATIKANPEMFGLTPEQVALLPDMTMDDIVNLIQFYFQQIQAFDEANKRFTVLQTPYHHAMVVQEESVQEQVRRWVFDYLKN